ncbi:VCBS domain-containing protein [Marimonas lutisalis]|uniref:VCBS domain-containing protein n=1 Tax=Marimonas lutisalis TaxID=2545756 RepID=UPI0010F9E493|nr:VCBS domain-containing protein [Marimonas lutisalis]
MARSITFTVEGPVDTLITIQELDDGTLRFDVEVLGSGLIGDLRGLFFDLADVDATTAGLEVTGVDGSEDVIGKKAFKEKGVDRVHKDVNVKGHVIHEQGKFDAGIEFGTPGKGKDDISSVSFILSADEALSLDSLDLADFGLRYTSVGDEYERDDSAKIAGDASGVARNDAWEVDENTTGTVDLLDNDTNGVQADGTRKTVISVVDGQGSFVAVGGGFQRTVEVGGLVLGTLFISDDGYATFAADGPDVDKLAHDDIRTWEFTYETQSSAGNLATADVVLTIDGQNDQPIAFDVALTVSEDDAFATVQNLQFDPLTGDGVTGSFVGSDIDIGDVLSYQIISAPTDAYGNQYGEVVNNGDGTFTFNPSDEFQFLNAGETRDVTFQYVAIDDSGVGTSPTSPEESDTSDPATITITVEGADDAPVGFIDTLQFETENQSMFGTGAALVLQPDLPFFGFNTGVQSLNATIVPKYTFSGDVLEGILEGIEAVAQVFADIGCGIVNFFGGDCDADIDLPSSITTPGVSTQGSFAAKVGLQPYFYFTSGDVDSQIPVDVYFEVPRQVENGETFSISSVYSVDGGATFNTMSPNVNFGMDFVFDLDTDLDLVLTSSTFGGGSTTGIWDLDTGNIAGFTGELGEPGFNLFDFSAEDDLETSIDFGDIATLDLNFPVIETTGTPDPVGSNTLTSEGEDDVAVLDIDVDAVVARIIQAATGVPIKFGDSDSFGLNIDVAGANVNLLSFEYAWDIVAVNLITTLKAVQEFALNVTDLPLMALLEDGSSITGFSLGDEITVVTPETSTFDPDVDGDADGLLDFDVQVDMEAVFANDSWLGLDMDLFAGLLRLTGGITSDFFSGPSISLFDGLIPSVDGNNDGFLFGNTFELLSDVRLATLFDEEFPIEGWNTATTDTNMYFDVA